MEQSLVKPRHLMAILKVTNSCNMACGYCYNSYKKNNKKIISAEETFIILEKLVNYIHSGSLHICFHGGEPLLADMNYYSSVLNSVKVFKERDVKFNFGIQTNGTLLTPEKIDILSSLGINIGISLDGDEVTSRLARPFLGGHNSYYKVAAAIQALKEHHVNCGVITVVSSKNVNNLIDVFEHHKALGITKISFNPIVLPAKTKFQITPDEWNNRMIELFQYYWSNQEDRKKIRIEPFDMFIGSSLSGNTSMCCQRPTCQDTLLGIDSNGDVLPCNRFGQEEGFIYGNIFTTPIDSIFDSKIRKTLLNRNEFIDPDCRVCPHFCRCNGGCVHNAISASGNPFQKDPFCSRRLYDVIESELRKSIQTKLATIRNPMKEIV
jgi:uncharacterized protein